MNYTQKKFQESKHSWNLKQLYRYSICGGISTLIMAIIMASLTLSFPHFVDENRLSQEILARNTNILNTAGFIPATIVAFFTNRRFVFQPGRHSVSKEFSLFLIIASIAYLGGALGSDWIVKYYQTPSYVGNMMFGFSTALINYICRKLFIFKA